VQAVRDEDLKVIGELTQTAVEALSMHLGDRKSILTEYFERWKTYTDTGREFRTQWQQFVTDARQVSVTLRGLFAVLLSSWPSCQSSKSRHFTLRSSLTGNCCFIIFCWSSLLNSALTLLWLPYWVWFLGI